MKYRGNTRNFELRLLEVESWPVDEEKNRTFHTGSRWIRPKVKCDLFAKKYD